MKYNRLGRSELTVSAVGLGTWALGGGTDWGPSDAGVAFETVSAALDAGITLFDTAPIYGESETVLGRALKGRRQKVVLATKCGLVKNGSWTDHDLRADAITAQLEQSLLRLQTDYIDLYQIHYPDPNVPLADALAVLARLREQGKIRYIGVCNVGQNELHEAVGQIISVQNELSLLHIRQAADVWPVCREKKIGFIGYGTLCGGILSGKYKQAPNLRRADARNYFYKCYRADAFLQAQKTVARVKEIARQSGAAAATVAGAWALAKENVSCALMGARSAKQVAENAAAAALELTAEEISFLEEGK